jgi:uridine monophosphate synthetase
LLGTIFSPVLELQMPPTLDLNSLAQTLFDIGAVRLGEFKLHSGRISPIYLDLRLLVSYPDALRQATSAYRTILDDLAFDLLAATPLAGLPIGTALCLDMNAPLIYPRKSAKGHGTGKSIEGVWRPGQTAVVVDDLVTSGDSIMQTIIALETAGLQVTDAVVLIDRQQGGVTALREKGYELHMVMTLGQMLTALENQGKITAALRSEVLSSLKDN